MLSRKNCMLRTMRDYCFARLSGCAYTGWEGNVNCFDRYMYFLNDVRAERTVVVKESMGIRMWFPFLAVFLCQK